MRRAETLKGTVEVRVGEMLRLAQALGAQADAMKSRRERAHREALRAHEAWLRSIADALTQAAAEYEEGRLRKFLRSTLRTVEIAAAVWTIGSPIAAELLDVDPAEIPAAVTEAAEAVLQGARITADEVSTEPVDSWTLEVESAASASRAESPAPIAGEGNISMEPNTATGEGTVTNPRGASDWGEWSDPVTTDPEPIRDATATPDTVTATVDVPAPAPGITGADDPEFVKTPLDRLAEAFPGSELVSEPPSEPPRD